MFTLGINLSHHSSIALLKDNEVLLFIHEERVNRQKYFYGIPYKALDLIKNYTSSIDLIVAVSGPRWQIEAIQTHLQQQGVNVKRSIGDSSNHHLAHAASGFYMSGMDQATVVVIDGAGAIYLIRKEGNIKASETTSIYNATFPKIECTNKHFVVGLYNTPPIVISNSEVAAFKSKFTNAVTMSTKPDIGWRYAVVTNKIGFGVFGEGKTMGLSAYGGLPDSDANSKAAYNVQKDLEKTFEQLFAPIRGNLVLSGGCGLNILGNSLIKRLYPNLNIFIDPVSADGTIALGAAAYHYYKATNSRDKLVVDCYRGPQYNLTKNYIYECARKYTI